MDTRTALLNSAEQACKRRGYDGFSYADLAQEVGIRKASIHHHFPTKAELAHALLQRYAERFFANLETISGQQVSGAARLAAYINSYREAVDGGKMVCLCVAFSAGRDSLNAAVLAELQRFDEASIVWLTEAFRLGKRDRSIGSVKDPRSEAAAALALVAGAQLQARAVLDQSRFDTAVAVLESRLE